MDPVIAHAIDGRLRIRVPAIRGDAAAAAALADRLRRLPGVRHVEVSRLTGSVVLRHDAAAGAAVWDGLRTVLPGLREMPAGAGTGPGPSARADTTPGAATAPPRDRGTPAGGAAEAAAAWTGAARAAAGRARRAARDADPATTLAAMFALLGLVDLAARGVRARRIPLPNWYELLWWAFSAYFALQGAASRRAAAAGAGPGAGPPPSPAPAPAAREEDVPPPLRWLPAPGATDPGFRGPDRP